MSDFTKDTTNETNNIKLNNKDSIDDKNLEDIDLSKVENGGINDEEALKHLMEQYKKAAANPPKLPKQGISFAAAARKNATEQDRIDTENYLKQLSEKLAKEKADKEKEKNDNGGSIFVGLYNDPKHPDCLRKIIIENDSITVIGSDNVDGTNEWKLDAKENDSGILVDFSPKGGPKDLLGVYDDTNGGIRWPDNNLWNKKV